MNYKIGDKVLIIDKNIYTASRNIIGTFSYSIGIIKYISVNKNVLFDYQITDLNGNCGRFVYSSQIVPLSKNGKVLFGS